MLLGTQIKVVNFNNNPIYDLASLSNGLSWLAYWSSKSQRVIRGISLELYPKQL